MSRLSLFARGTLISVLFLGSCVVSFAQPGAASAPVRSSVVIGQTTEAVPVTRKKYIGNIEAIEQVDSVARVSGFLKVAEGFEEGTMVKKGQLLFEIDPIPYQAKVDAAQAAIAQIEAKIVYAETNYKRLSSLFEKNAGSQDDKESAYAELQSLKAQLASAQANLTLAKEDLGYTRIESQIDGRAGRRSYSTGNYVTPQSSPLIRVVQLDPIYVRFTMSERDFINYFGNLETLKKNAEISLTLPNDSTYDQKGEICFIDNAVKSTTDTIKIWAKFSNKDELLNPGGVVTVNLALKGNQSTPAVIPTAVMFDGKTNYVYILVDSIDDETLFKEIASDSRFAKDLEAIEKGEKSKEDFLAAFKKQRYEYEDPQTGEACSDLVNGKVNEKYRMVLRRNIELGPSDGSLETIVKGLGVNQTIVLDGVHKARPFDLVRPFAPRSKEPVKEQEEKATESAQAVQKKATTAPAEQAKRIETRKPDLASLFVKNAGDNA